MRQPLSLILVGVFLVLGVACGKGGGGVPAVAAGQTDGPDGLKAVFQALAQAHAAGDVKKAKELTLSLMPDDAALKKALRDDAPADVVARIRDTFSKIPTSDEAVAKLLVPGEGRTEIKPHGATTEEIAAYESGGVAHAEFPGGARRLAESILRPGVTFYEVEVTEPGKDSGTKYHLFFWDGSRWRMLGPAWRALPQ
jgi:hypothetical protein